MAYYHIAISPANQKVVTLTSSDSKQPFSNTLNRLKNKDKEQLFGEKNPKQIEELSFPNNWYPSKTHFFAVDAAERVRLELQNGKQVVMDGDRLQQAFIFLDNIGDSFTPEMLKRLSIVLESSPEPLVMKDLEESDLHSLKEKALLEMRERHDRLSSKAAG